MGTADVLRISWSSFPVGSKSKAVYNDMPHGMLDEVMACWWKEWCLRWFLECDWEKDACTWHNHKMCCAKTLIAFRVSACVTGRYTIQGTCSWSDSYYLISGWGRPGEFPDLVHKYNSTISCSELSSFIDAEMNWTSDGSWEKNSCFLNDFSSAELSANSWILHKSSHKCLSSNSV